VLLAAAVLRAPDARALTLREGFETWPFTGGCTGTHREGCSQVFGCGNHAELIVRRVAAEPTNGACDDGHAVRQWTGGMPGGVGERGRTSRWSALHVAPAGDGGALELLTSRDKQRDALSGELQVDFYVDSSQDLPRGSGEHYLIFHNLSVHRIDACAEDCPDGATDTATNHATGSERWKWYGVIAGGFGEREGLGFGRLGFAVEVPNDDPTRVTDLVDESFIPFGEKTGRFPTRRWYRVKIRRAIESGVDRYSYSAAFWDRARAKWKRIGERSFGSELLKARAGEFLPAGYVGVTDAFFDEQRRREGVRVAWDNLRVNW